MRRISSVKGPKMTRRERGRETKKESKRKKDREREREREKRKACLVSVHPKQEC